MSTAISVGYVRSPAFTCLLVWLPHISLSISSESEVIPSALRALSLKGGGAHEFADSGMHVHQQIHLGNLRDIALHIDDVFLRVGDRQRDIRQGSPSRSHVAFRDRDAW